MLNLKSLLYLEVLLGIGLWAWHVLLSPQARRWMDGRFATFVLLLPAIAYLAPNLTIYYCGLAVVMIFFPRSRVEAAGMFIVGATMLPMVQYRARLGDIGLLTLNTPAVLGLALVATLFMKAPRNRPASAPQIDMLFAALFLLLMVIAVRITGMNTTTLLRQILDVTVFYLVPYIALCALIAREGDLRRLLAYVAGAAFLLAIVAMFETARHWPLYEAIEPRYGVFWTSKVLNVRAGLMRSPGPFFESTTFGVFLAIGTIFVTSMRSIFRSREAYWLAIIVLIGGSLGTLARNGMLGLILGCIAAAIYSGRLKIAGAVMLAMFLLMTGLVVEASSGFFREYIGASGHAASTMDYRESLWNYGTALVRQNPWAGLPQDIVTATLTPVLRSGSVDVDYVNSYLYFALTTGIFGAFLFMIVWLWSIMQLGVRRKKSLQTQAMTEVTSAVWGALVAFALMVCFTAFAERIPLFGVLLLVFARAALGRLRAPAANPRRSTDPVAVPARARAIA